VTLYIKKAFDHANKILMGEPGYPLSLRGPGGVGKTTGLVAIDQSSQAKGYLCVFIQLKELTSVSPVSGISKWALNCLENCLSVFKDDESNPWKHIAVSEARLPNVSCFDLLKFLSKGDDDDECLFGLQRLFLGLVQEQCCPVVFCLDQWNEMEKDYWTDGIECYTKTSHPLMRVFGSWEIASQTVIFKALSSSCRADIPRASDGNGSICGEYTVKVWLIQMIRESVRPTCDEALCTVADCSEEHVAAPLLDDENKAIARLCGCLPREMIRYLVDSDGTNESYLRHAVKQFKIHVAGLISKDSETR
jgi:hypothetical protein